MTDNNRPDFNLFLASSVHDMKNSISLLMGSLEGIVRNTSPEECQDYGQLAQMLYETQRINGHLIQLLTLYKLDNNLYPFSPDTVDVAEFVAEAQSHVQVLLESKGIAFEVDLAPELYAEFDQDLIAGVVIQAMSNAANYTRDCIRLVALPCGAGVEFRVEDNGRGFPQRMIDEGVAAMRGVDFSTGSTGLGLYFAATVAQMHRNRDERGSIHLENGGSLGGGCFVMRLP